MNSKRRKRIQFTFPHNGVTATAELLEEFAPRTCAAMWSALQVPARGIPRQAKYVGCELLLELPHKNQTFDPRSVPVFPLGSGENLAWLPSPGDIFWCYFPPYYLQGRPSEMWEIVMIYGRDSKVIIGTGLCPLNHFAVVTENFERWAETCRSVLVAGPKEIVIERAP